MSLAQCSPLGMLSPPNAVPEQSIDSKAAPVPIQTRQESLPDLSSSWGSNPGSPVCSPPPRGEATFTVVIPEGGIPYIKPFSGHDDGIDLGHCQAGCPSTYDAGGANRRALVYKNEVHIVEIDEANPEVFVGLSFKAATSLVGKLKPLTGVVERATKSVDCSVAPTPTVRALEECVKVYLETRERYLKAVHDLKLATGPYKAAREAYIAATATYTTSLYD